MSPTDAIPGRLIAVEGLDGSGKSTQIHLVHQWLQGLRCKVFFSEWNSSIMVKTATRKGKKKQMLTPTTFSLIHATDFADRYERQRPRDEGRAEMEGHGASLGAVRPGGYQRVVRARLRRQRPFQPPSFALKGCSNDR